MEGLSTEKSPRENGGVRLFSWRRSYGQLTREQLQCFWAAGRLSAEDQGWSGSGCTADAIDV